MGRKVLAFAVLVAVSLAVLIVLTALDPFSGNVALTAAVEAVVIGVLAYGLTYVAVPRGRSPRR
jgi:CBS-domain-containing membrane protein